MREPFLDGINRFGRERRSSECVLWMVGASEKTGSAVGNDLGYATYMKVLRAAALLFCLITLLLGISSHATESTASGESTSSEVASISKRLEIAIDSILPISRELTIRRRIAQATFCLPQSILGGLLYGLLQLSGSVVGTATMNEVTIVVTDAPVAVSLGAYIVVHESLIRENVLRHEYGHTMQGYKHGPFFLLLEGTVSLVQAAISLISPSFAAGYYDRWPEDEATALGARI